MSLTLELGRKLLAELREDWAGAVVWLDNREQLRIRLPEGKELAAYDAGFLKAHKVELFAALREELQTQTRAPEMEASL